jgi:hypothetical protein
MANFQGILEHSPFFAIPGSALFFSVTSVFSVAGAISGLGRARNEPKQRCLEPKRKVPDTCVGTV